MALHSVLELSYHKDQFDKNNIRVDEQEMQYRYYSGDAHNIKLLLTEVLGITYAQENIEEMQLQWINITEKIINQMSVVYLEPAMRKIVVNEDESEDLTKYYHTIIPMDINSSDKQAHRLAKLHNTSLPHVLYDEKKKRFKYKTIPSYLYNVKSEGGDLTEVSYDKYFDNEFFTVVWTEDEHYRVDAFDNRSALPGRDKEDNPFKIIPFPKLRLKNSVDFWGEGQNDLINVNEQVNLLLTKLVNSDVIMGTEGTMFTVNLGLDKKGEVEEGIRKIRTGRKHPISVEGAKVEDVQPSMSHVTTDPHIQDVQLMIDWYIRMIANFKGLNPNAVLSQVKDTSDFQKLMDAVEQMEIRMDDIEPCRMFEQERFEITKVMNNTLVGTAEGKGLKEIPEDAKLIVDFGDIEVQMTPKDKREDLDWKLKKNLTNLVQILREENPDLTKEQAEEIIANNRTANGALGTVPNRFELLTQPQTNEEL